MFGKQKLELSALREEKQMLLNNIEDLKHSLDMYIADINAKKLKLFEFKNKISSYEEEIQNLKKSLQETDLIREKQSAQINRQNKIIEHYKIRFGNLGTVTKSTYHIPQVKMKDIMDSYMESLTQYEN